MKDFKQLRSLVVGFVASTAVTFSMAAAPEWESEPGVRKLLIEPDVTSPAAARQASGLSDRWAELHDKAVSDGTVRVIVTLRVPFAPEGKLGPQIAAAQRSEIATAQRAVERVVPRRDRARLHSYETIPFMAMQLDSDQLDAVLSSPEVVDVREDQEFMASLDQSIPFIRANENWSSGYTGSGKTVVVIDNGVQKTHPFLSGRVVSEACYSLHDTVNGIYSYCPGDVSESTATDSAARCGLFGDSCYHGTHVAGISSGQGGGFSGVAKSSSVIAIQTFHWVQSLSDARTAWSNILKGLERAYALRNTYSIASVNMSLGGGAYSSQTTCDNDFSSLKAVIDQLRSVGIATVIASGNDGSSTTISGPGCISTAIAVGATLNASNEIASYSNSSALLDLLAPGSSINSSIPTDTYSSYNGTSMATPHVAGCWAVLKQAKPTATVTEVLNALQATGPVVTDPRNGIARARIDCKAAQDMLLGAASYTLSVAVSGAGSGVVTSGDSAIACGALASACSASYFSGTNVVLTATASAGSIFTGWSGACSGASPICTVAMSSAKSVGASFAPSSTQTITLVSNSPTTTAGTWLRYTFALPSNAANLRVTSLGGTGDADLYVRFNSAPDLNTYDCRPYLDGNAEECFFASPSPGTYHVGLHAYLAFSGVTLTITYDTPQVGDVGSRRYGDHNGDGKGDVLFQRSSDGAVAIWLMNGTAYSSAGIVNYAMDWRVAGGGDFDGDGKSDIVFQHKTDGRVAVWLMNGLTRTSFGVPGSAVGWKLISTGDFNGDGKDDILFQHSTDGRIAVWLMNGAGRLSAAVVASANGWVARGSGDFNGDGKADVFFNRVADGAVAVWLMNGTAIVSAAITQYAAGWTPLFTGNFNGDAKADIVFQHNTDGRVAVWMMNGIVRSSFAVLSGTTTWRITAVRDFNGDGKSDLLWNSPTDVKQVWLMNGTSLLQQGAGIPAIGWRPVH